MVRLGFVALVILQAKRNNRVIIPFYPVSVYKTFHISSSAK